METITSGPDVEVIVNNPLTMPAVAQQQGQDAPHRRTPPKKQKRTTRPVPSKYGNTGRETSEIWNHFFKFTAKGDLRVNFGNLVRSMKFQESKTKFFGLLSCCYCVIKFEHLLGRY
nr:uncharacterized protein LOC117281533 isoform X2 [Nicotiana tomentosiformis]